MGAATIYIYGEIGYDVSAIDVVNQIRDLEPGSDLTLKIHSPGGSVYEGFAIHELLTNSGHNITTIGEGLVGSIATVIFMAGKQRKLTKMSRFFVHMPLVMHAEGNADNLEETVKDLREWEKLLVDFYSTRTKAGKRQLKELLKAETEMSAQNALDLGFATEILEPVMALATFKQNNEEMARLSDVLKGLLGKEEVVNLELSTDTGETLKINTQEKHPAIGQEVMIGDASAEDGEYYVPAMAKVLKVKAGKIEDVLNRELELEKELNDEQAEKLVSDLTAALNTKFEHTLTAKVNPIFENQKSQGETVAALAKKVDAQQTFIEAQSKAFEDYKAQTVKALQEKEQAFTDYKNEVEKSFRLIASNYTPPFGGGFGGNKNEVKIERSALEERKREIQNKNKTTFQ